MVRPNGKTKERKFTMSTNATITISSIQHFHETLKKSSEEYKQIKNDHINEADRYHHSKCYELEELLDKQARYWEGKQSEAELVLKCFEIIFKDELAEEL